MSSGLFRRNFDSPGSCRSVVSWSKCVTCTPRVAFFSVDFKGDSGVVDVRFRGLEFLSVAAFVSVGFRVAEFSFSFAVFSVGFSVALLPFSFGDSAGFVVEGSVSIVVVVGSGAVESRSSLSGRFTVIFGRRLRRWIGQSFTTCSMDEQRMQLKG